MGVNINFFLTLISAILFSIFVFIKPFELEKIQEKEVAMLEINDFTIYELDTKGLNTKLMGSHAFKYTNRYEIDDIDYTDSSHELSDNLRAKFGKYEEDLITLIGNVHYLREDGTHFESDEAQYQNEMGILTTQKDFLLYQNRSWFKGSKLFFDTKKERYHAVGVEGSYQLVEEDS